MQDTDLSISPAIKSLKENLQRVQNILVERQKEINNAGELLKLSNTTTLLKGLESLQQQFTDATAIVKAAQKTLGLSETDPNISMAITNIQGQLTEKSQEVKNAGNSLNLSAGISLKAGEVFLGGIQLSRS